MIKKKILIVDDEDRIRLLIKDFLLKEGYLVLEASDGNEALDIYFNTEGIDLVILDVMLPKISGWDILKELREYSRVPVIMLTALGDERNELKGFELGVDEYIVKPFSPKILMARVEAVLRRSSKLSDNQTLVAGDLELNKASHSFKCGECFVDLSFKEFELLSFFIENKGLVLSRDSILSAVWEYDFDGDARTVDTHVKKLRSKMGPYGDCIKTVWGVGYKLEV